MDLGIFSVSLNVKDLNASKEFYEKLGFSKMAGSPEHRYFIMKSGKTLIGLFQGMFEKNMLTFNPGWDENANQVNPFDDIRVIQNRLKKQGVHFESEADESTTGPDRFMVIDPDGNPILVDQHR